MTISEIGRFVRNQRREHNLRQAELAAIAGVGTRFVSDLENGKFSLEMGKAIQVLETVGLELAVARRSSNWETDRGAQ